MARASSSHERQASERANERTSDRSSELTDNGGRYNGRSNPYDQRDPGPPGGGYGGYDAPRQPQNYGQPAYGGYDQPTTSMDGGYAGMCLVATEWEV